MRADVRHRGASLLCLRDSFESPGVVDGAFHDRDLLACGCILVDFGMVRHSVLLVEAVAALGANFVLQLYERCLLAGPCKRGG